MKLVVVSGGTSDPSSTRMLADRITARVLERATDAGLEVSTSIIELRPLAAELASALVVATPVYKAGVSGLVKSFFDVVDQDLLIAVPTVLAATAGTSRHALVADEQLRSLFAYLRALSTPTSVFAASEDWGSKGLGERIDRAAHELIVLAAADVKVAMRDAGTHYNRIFGGASEGADEVEFDTDLMRLATGGPAVIPPVRAV
jgi:FMN reductase